MRDLLFMLSEAGVPRSPDSIVPSHLLSCKQRDCVCKATLTRFKAQLWFLCLDNVGIMLHITFYLQILLSY